MVVALEEGTLVDGRYRLERELGAGGMGVVWSARQVATGQPVALKFLRDPEKSPLARRRFLREARAACAVRHPNVVMIHDFFVVDDDTPVIVMEMLQGESFSAKLKREKRLGLDEFARLMLPVVSAVGTAHAHGIVHRDLKPDNIFLAKDAGGVLVKVLDFGVAKLTANEGDAEKTAGLTDTGTVVGTPYYMSPEQAFGERDVDHRTDIWALGIIFYQCLSSSLPTRAANVGQILKIIFVSDAIVPLSILVPDLPDDILTLISQMLARDRARRPADLRVVQAVLRRYGDVSTASFGTAIAPPRSSGKLPDSSDEHSALFDAGPPTSPGPVPSDAPTKAEPASNRLAPGAAHPSEQTVATPEGRVSSAKLGESAAGSVTTLPEAGRPRRTRSFSQMGLIALAVGGVGLAGWTVRGQRASSLAVASASDAPAAQVAAPPARPDPRPAASGETPVASATPARSGGTKDSQPAVETKRVHAAPQRARPGSTPASSSSSSAATTAQSVFVDKPPF